MINPTLIHGKRLAMIAWAKKDDGGDDVTVFTGIASWDGKTMTMRREPIESSLEIEMDWLERIQEVRPDLRDTLLGAEYSFSVSVGDISEADNPSELKQTGLKWPNK
jgi:hypothetical protein